ncbi:MAG: ATP-binding protein [Chloroflexota bacterium]|nr:MAG: ATP-binding protein [Chloroflexota bacterium]
MEERRERLAPDVARIREMLGQLPAAMPRPVLVMVAGLPGSGKSHFSRLLSRRLSAVIVQSDAVRQTLFRHPTYSPEESFWVFSVIHQLLRDLLRERIPVILDATNLLKSNREQVYDVAKQTGAKLIIVWVEAPPEVVFARMERRAARADRSDRSEAGWIVYEKLRAKVEPISQPHFVVDTSRDVRPIVNKVVREARR